MEPLLTTEQIAEWLQVDVVTVRRLVECGELAAYRVGGEYRFEKKDIQEYLSRVRVKHPRRPSTRQPDPRWLPGLLGAIGGIPGRAADDRFDKFTEAARKVLTLAQEEAQRLNHNYIGTEHLLLGLVRVHEGVGAKVLASMGVDLGTIRPEVEAIVGRGNHTVKGETGLISRAKKVIELAVDEARQIGQHHIGTEQILLGMIREREGAAAAVLGKLGVDLEEARHPLARILAEQAGSR